MNQEEDEDAFLYGETKQTATSGKSLAPASGPADHDMEPPSEEGEVDDDDDEEEEEDDSVVFLHSTVLIKRTLNLLLKQNLGNELLHRRTFLVALHIC